MEHHEVDHQTALYTRMVSSFIRHGFHLTGLARVMQELGDRFFPVPAKSRQSLSRYLPLAQHLYEAKHVQPLLDSKSPYSVIFDNHHAVCGCPGWAAFRTTVLPICVSALFLCRCRPVSPGCCVTGCYPSTHQPTPHWWYTQNGQILVVVVRGLLKGTTMWQRVCGLWHTPVHMTAADLARSLVEVFQEAQLDLRYLQSFSADRVAYNIRAIRSLRVFLRVCANTSRSLQGGEVACAS